MNEIVLRRSKGSALTFNELDDNFEILANQIENIDDPVAMALVFGSAEDGADPIGEGQSWASIATPLPDTSYQNTQGRTIAVSIDVTITAGAAQFQVSRDGSTWVTVSRAPSLGTTTLDFHRTLLVPAGNYWQVTQVSGTVGIDSMVALR